MGRIPIAARFPAPVEPSVTSGSRDAASAPSRRPEAVNYFREALKHYQKLHEAESDNVVVQLAETWHKLGVNHPAEDSAEARQARASCSALPATWPGSPS
ncbi:MAG: hypothetical protein JNM56_26790 [Planctomycetia bacterium]|nr:hypothetical protein [Planctomycetia bacterium]